MASNVPTVEDLVESFTKVGLIKECRKRGLEVGGDKNELASRIVLHAEEQADQNGGMKRNVGKVDDSDSSREEESDFEGFQTPDDGMRQKRRIRRRYDHKEQAKAISLRDLEDSMEKFGAINEQDVKVWMEDFEGMAETVGLTDLQKFVLCKKVLEGTAKKFVLAQGKLSNWGKLKAALLKEFSKKVSAADIHRRLTNRKKDQKESFRDYLYDMQRIAKAGRVDEKTICEYVCDGIPGDIGQKTMLYEAQSIEELKEKLEVYEKLQAKGKGTLIKTSPADGSKTEEKDTEKTIKSRGHCYNCGEDGHVSNECPDKEKGPKCFKCNEYDHLAKDCKGKSSKSTKAVAQVNMIQVIQSDYDVIKLKIGAYDEIGVVDTFSDVSLIKESLWKKVRAYCGELQPARLHMRGFGGGEFIAKAAVTVKMWIEGEVFEVLCYVVTNDAIDPKLLIGRNFLKSVDYTIKPGCVSIRPKRADEFIVKAQEEGSSVDKSEGSGVNDCVRQDSDNQKKNRDEIKIDGNGEADPKRVNDTVMRKRGLKEPKKVVRQKERKMRKYAMETKMGNPVGNRLAAAVRKEVDEKGITKMFEEKMCIQRKENMQPGIERKTAGVKRGSEASGADVCQEWPCENGVV
uniref:Uncharacterized protein n=1 Tax=Lutzomyia longipalpis TaxID=7200 RepID=A0A1B0CR74_LUTLO